MPKKKSARDPNWISRWDANSEVAAQVEKDFIDPNIEFFPDQYSAVNFYRSRKAFVRYCSPTKFRNNIREIADRLKDAGYSKERKDETDPTMAFGKSKYYLFNFTLFYSQYYSPYKYFQTSPLAMMIYHHLMMILNR